MNAFATAIVAFPLFAACSCTASDHPPGLAPCTSGCTTGGGTSIGPPSDGGLDAQDSGDAATTPLSGNVAVYRDDHFADTETFTGEGLVHLPTLSGEVVLPIGGDAGVSFSVDNALVGYGWFAAIPDTSFNDAGSAWGTLVPTWSLLAVPEAGSKSFVVPLANLNLINAIYAGLATQKYAHANASQVVVVFERQGQRVPNVALTKAPTSEAIAFDIGVGYSAEATATGDFGVAILINTIGTGDIEWEIPNSSKGAVTLYAVAGGVSVIKIEVP